ncbi:MAG: hypothetical protein AAGD10_14975 [Myxococcota bacterium]
MSRQKQALPWLGVGLLFLTACASGSLRPPAEGLEASAGAVAEEGREDGLLPPVFTADQIRSATPAGRTYVWRFEAGAEVSIQRLRFLRVDDEGAVTRSYADGQEGPEAYLRWEELEAHGRYPDSTTTRSRTVVEVPFGRFEGWHYTSQGPSERTEVWFADELPGAPIRQRIEKDGQQVFFMELLDHSVEPLWSD